jgi:hypothetical protein
MRKTRVSLFYLAGYLSFGGLGLLFFPGPSLRLFLSTGDYSVPMVRLVGVLLLSLAIIVVQVIRHRAEALYPTTLLVRFVILAVLVWLYFSTVDPLFLVLTGIVGLGVLLTGFSYLRERRRGSPRVV